MSYTKPTNRVHKGFIYLDDEIITNSLSAAEAGKIDEILGRVSSSITSSVDGGISARIPIAKASTQVERDSAKETEEVVRKTRTRFSIFEAWLKTLESNNAIGSFDGWGYDALVDVVAGDTVRLRAMLQTSGAETVFKLFGWYVDNSEGKDAFFPTDKENLAELRKQRRTMTQIIGGRSDRTTFTALPLGEPGPTVSLTLKELWRIGDFGDMEGVFNIVAQVSHVVNENEVWPAIRMIPGAPFTSLERETLLSSLSNFRESAQAMGVIVSDSDALVPGPALILTPIAIYR